MDPTASVASPQRLWNAGKYPFGGARKVFVQRGMAFALSTPET